MKSRKRLTNILIAGTLTALMLTVYFAFNGGEKTAALEAESSVAVTNVEMVGNYESDIAALQAQIESLQTQNAAYAAQNEELRAAVNTLQARESEYQTQIEAANQTINELSAQASGLAQGGQAFGDFQRPPHEHNN